MRRVLIAEDDGALREALREALLAQGLDVEVAVNADEASRSCQAEDFDAVLSDIRMPGNTNGTTMVQRLQRARPTVSVVLMTGFDEPGHRERALAQGAVDYLVKPIQLHRLRAALDRAFELRDSARQA